MRWAALFAVLPLAGCAATNLAACPAGMSEMWRGELMFGRNIGGTLGVSEADWDAFAAAEIAPRFPAGFTVMDGAGEWRGGDGATVRAPSKILMVVAPRGVETRARLDAIAAAYKVRFHQEAVGMVLEPACVSF